MLFGRYHAGTILFLAAATLSQASTIMSDPIAVTGRGTYFYSTTDGTEFNVSLAGNDGVNFVAAQCESRWFFGLCMENGAIGASIDGQYFHTGFYSLYGGNSITGYDSQMHAVITQPITMVIEITSNVCSGTWEFRDCLETFNLVSAPTTLSANFAAPTAVPEPATWALALAGLAALFMAHRKQSHVG